MHSLGRVCQSAWAKNGALVRVAGHQPRLLLLVSISSLEQSSQGQALSWALPAPASPPGPSDPFVFLTHSPPPPMLSPPIRYSLSSPPPFFPSSLLSLLCPFPDSPRPSPRPFSTLVPSPPFPALYHSLSLSLSVYLYLSLPPLPPKPQQEPFVSRSSAGGSRNLLLPTPQTHAQLGRSSHCSATLPSHHPSIHNHSQAISFCCPLTHHGSQGSSRVGLRSPSTLYPPRETFHSQLG